MVGRRVRPSLLGVGALVLVATAALAAEVVAGAPPDPFAAMNAARAVREVPAPSFKVPTLDGRPLALEDLKGKTVLFYYWRTW